MNQCDSGSDCGGGRCVENRCVAESGQIKRLLVEVVPPVTTSRVGEGDAPVPSIASVRYLTDLVLPEKGTDFLPSREREAFGIELRPIAQVTGAVDLSNIATESCSFDEVESITLHARFTPSEQLLGLSATSYTTEVTSHNLAEPVEFDIKVPPGYYDIYLQGSMTYLPTAAEGSQCDMTPRLFRKRPIGIAASSEAPAFEEPVDGIRIPLLLAKPATLMVHLLSDLDLEGWTLDMVDSQSGLLISTQKVLEDSSGGYQVPLAYSSVDYSSTTAPEVLAETEVLRLSPPADVVAPTLYAARVGLELFVANEAVMELKQLPPVVDVVGQVLLNSDASMSCAQVNSDSTTENPCSVPFGVQILSSADFGKTSTFNDTIPKGMIASYQRVVETNPDLSFRVRLPVGEYRAVAVPTVDEQRPWAIGEDAWVIGDEDREVHGKSVTVRARARVSGQVIVQTQQMLRASTVLELTRRASFVPRAATTTLSENGAFDVRADAGVFDLSVRPDAASGYAWLVKPNINVMSSSSRAEQSLGTLTMPLPVRYAGAVKSLNLGGNVADALIRAHVYLDAEGVITEEPSEAYSVLQVAETRADREGRFELLLPAELLGTE